MASAKTEFPDICRFCLSQDSLVPALKATLLSIQDIELFTGIQFADDEKMSFAVCEKCRRMLEKSVIFRNNCLENDIVFKQVFSVLVECVIDELDVLNDTVPAKNEPLSIKSDDQIDVEELSFADISTTANEPADIEQIMGRTYIKKLPHCSKRPRTQKRVKNIRGKSEIESEPVVEKMIIPEKKNERQTKLCAVCGKLVRCMLRHNELHDKEKKYACPHCHIKMANPENMKRHIDAIHMKRILKSCELCGKDFIHQKSFVRHMISEHGIGRQTYECKICSTSFKIADCYRHHMNRWHKPRKDFTCTTCNKIFHENKALKHHQRVHSSEQPYACSQCPKRFKSPYARKTHEFTHTGIRFSCELCKKSYRYKSILSVHYRKDHGGALQDVNGQSKYE